METKTCLKCKGILPKSDFYSKGVGKLRALCKICFKAYKENGPESPNSKRFCPRGEGSEISVSQCYPGCNVACKTCKHMTEDKTINNYTGQEINGTQSSAGYTVDMAPKCF